MKDGVHIEVNCNQKNHFEERICGDVFLSKRIRDEERTVVVLSDGMGHGVKANILATLTATMALNFTEEHKDYSKTAEIIMNTLPVCSVRGDSSYATFTIIDITNKNEVAILEYDNPQTIVMRGKTLLPIDWQTITLESGNNFGKEIHFSKFNVQKEDRIISCSDGVTQSGLGLGKYIMGWGHDALAAYVQKLVADTPDISAAILASKVVYMAHINDLSASQDDTSCSVIYFRNPRKLLICTGPPFELSDDKEFAQKTADYQGKVIVCGATTADIISRELNREITDSVERYDHTLPPTSYMEGIDLITEGVLTLSRVEQILKIYNSNYTFGKGPADQIVKIMINSDIIDMLVGTKLNDAHQNPAIAAGLEIRRILVKRIAELLEEKFLKEITLNYI